ncbi:cyclic-di-GMP phosphodiesterase TipF (flagellum assembly factor) [Azospirillum brasilense]|uniref:Cyclic-di-GMP phosphodiesterase TipF (Flagellum assembly factor) n=1 Tax=Azospirillum brasilense TaxID=192 RepID=A0A560CJ83_AZOBR|nr:EAL domain-containing protein [Azospirillum brasilense]TWA84942.1 cyclic-di-GMP phosphodiesterase TipF (flagellum assembly factor) [Azospirillum brasilense]
MAALAAFLHGLAVAAAAVSVALGLPELRPGTDPAMGWIGGGLILLAGAAVDLHRRLARRQRDTLERLDRLQKSVDALAERLEPRVAPEAEAGDADRSAATHEAVLQEVRLLHALVARLGEVRPAEEREAPPPSGPGAAFPDSRRPDPQPAAKAEARLMDGAGVLEVVRDALAADRIDVHLQPIVSLPQRKHRFFEVFSRVRAADGALILPDRYLEIAERAGLMATIDNLLLVRCIQLIRETERRQHAIGFFCNMSAATLSDAAFMRQFLDLMVRNQTLVPKLAFELSQQELRAGGAVTMGILSQLARIGFRFSMDRVTDLDIDVDALLRHEIRYVKLDCGLLLDPVLAPRIEDLRHRLDGTGIDLIAEKIETEAQLDAIQRSGIDFGQGYLFGEPRPARKPS